MKPWENRPASLCDQSGSQLRLPQGLSCYFIALTMVASFERVEVLFLQTQPNMLTPSSPHS